MLTLHDDGDYDSQGKLIERDLRGISKLTLPFAIACTANPRAPTKASSL